MGASAALPTLHLALAPCALADERDGAASREDNQGRQPPRLLQAEHFTCKAKEELGRVCNRSHQG